MIILKNGIYIDWETLEFSQEDIVIDLGGRWSVVGGQPSDLGPLTSEYPNQILDCTGMYITKSFVNGHHHVYSALARGMPPPAVQPSNFHEKLKNVWWKLDQALTSEMIYSSALVTAIACARSGCTYVIDHHSSPSATSGSLELIAKAFHEVGISHLLCFEITDRNGPQKAQEGLDETEGWLSINPGLVGLHAGFTVGDKTLAEAVELAQIYKSGIHIHVAEDPIDEDASVKKYGKRVVQRFKDAGVLDLPESIFAHCLHLDDHERELLNKSGIHVAVNTESNLNNKVGYFSSRGLGDQIMLGTDGMHSDMLQSARAAWFVLHNFNDISLSDVYGWLRNSNRYLQKTGISGDLQGDLVVLDYNSPTPMNAENFLSHLFYGFNSSHIRHVISNGRIILEDFQVTTIDEDILMKESRRLAEILWRKI